MMQIQELKAGGVTFLSVTPDEALAAGVNPALVAAAVDEVVIEQAHAAVRALGRRAYTDDPVQAGIYTTKFAEAKAYIAANRPANVSAADYPFLSAEAAARGVTKSALADLIVGKGNAWQAFAAAMEVARTKITADVTAATGVSAKQAAAQAVVDQLSAALAQASL